MRNEYSEPERECNKSSDLSVKRGILILHQIAHFAFYLHHPLSLTHGKAYRTQTRQASRAVAAADCRRSVYHHPVHAANLLGARRKGHCRGGDGWRAGGLVCRCRAVPPGAHSFISRHTAIIPRNKDRIGDNLGQFVQEKFLDTQSLVDLIRRYEPAQMIGTWFSQPDNARRVGQHLVQVMGGFLNLPTMGASSACSNARCIRLSTRSI